MKTTMQVTYHKVAICRLCHLADDASPIDPTNGQGLNHREFTGSELLLGILDILDIPDTKLDTRALLAVKSQSPWLATYADSKKPAVQRKTRGR